MTTDLQNTTKFLIVFFIIFTFTELKAQQANELANKLHVQFSLRDYIGCIETCNDLIKTES